MATQGGPHPFRAAGWRWWLCRHCYFPRNAHPVHFWAVARPLRDREHLTLDEAVRREFAAQKASRP